VQNCARRDGPHKRHRLACATAAVRVRALAALACATTAARANRARAWGWPVAFHAGPSYREVWGVGLRSDFPAGLRPGKQLVPKYFERPRHVGNTTIRHPTIHQIPKFKNDNSTLYALFIVSVTLDKSKQIICCESTVQQPRIDKRTIFVHFVYSGSLKTRGPRPWLSYGLAVIWRLRSSQTFPKLIRAHSATVRS